MIVMDHYRKFETYIYGNQHYKKEREKEKEKEKEINERSLKVWIMGEV